MKENRKTPRFGPLVIKAQVNIDGEKYEGFLTNLSRNGGFLAIDDPPKNGRDLHVWALLPWRLGELRAYARVVWRNAQETRDETTGIAGVGITFTELDQGSAELLELYLARFAELAALVD